MYVGVVVDRTYTIAEGVCQSWEAVVVEEGGERVCSTRLANWTHPDTDDWSITRHDPRASLQHNVEDTRCDQHTLAFINPRRACAARVTVVVS